MTTLTMPLERRLLRSVREGLETEPARDWPRQSVELCLSLLRGLREGTAEMRQGLEEELAEGVEARSFARTYGPVLPAADEQAATVGQLVEWLSPAEDGASRSLVAELRLLEREHQALRDLLAQALARASGPPRPADAARVRAAEEAHARGETKPFSRR
ncbi:MAG TPA: hypothetical protein VFE78_34220 [Gemmataceae bacterium]|jgi:hypothetical protein|nr:hypothetical protein [Gemmataceae bacterium]